MPTQRTSTPTEIPQRRSTNQRTVVLEVVKRSHSHPSAEEVYRVAKRKLPSLSLGTVYRNLGLLVEDGRIREVQFIGGAARYDGMTEQHEHFVCTKCGAVHDLPRSLETKLIKKRGGPLRNALVTDYRLDLYGLCATCNAA
ncbi:MAG: transcriptional repressor [Candidatus Kapaibacterium sp.]|jgi:Fur family peroxide stress response transcriptional regulator